MAPGPAGAPSRGRADVLPTGRNLTSIDPRAIPTRTASAIGVRAANEVVRRYLQDHGEPPRALVIDLWASASLRTGGDDLAQALWYLGVQPTWDKASSRVTGIEILPLAALDRPRIDVTLRISGLFRDIFETQIALFDMAVRRIAELDEEAADNPLAEARRRGADLARVFGGAPGSYGAQAADTALDGDWRSRDELGEVYLAAVTHAYGGAEPVRAAGDGFRTRVSEADALVHPQDDRERDLLDGDGVADFAGGFAAAAALLGNEPELYHLDTSRTDSAQGAPAGRGNRPHRARPAHQSALARRHAGARPSRRRRDRPGRRCALCLRRDHPRRARSSVRCHARRPDRRRGRADGHDGEEPGGDRGDRRAAARRPGARALDDAAQRGRSRARARDHEGRIMNSAASAQVKGWCPGALRPMLSGDGLIVRIRPFCGAFGLEQARGLADLARRLGNGHIDLTRRANLQLRGLLDEHLPELHAELGKLGLLDPDAETEATRNLMVAPLAGLDPAESLDVRPIARAIADGSCRRRTAAARCRRSSAC